MSGNLGWYQTIVTLSKKVGGPKQLIALLVSGGAALGIAIENLIKQLVKLAKDHSGNQEQTSDASNDEYVAVESYSDEHGLVLAPGDTIQVISAIDDEALLVTKVGDENSPYVLSQELLERVVQKL